MGANQSTNGAQRNIFLTICFITVNIAVVVFYGIRNALSSSNGVAHNPPPPTEGPDWFSDPDAAAAVSVVSAQNQSHHHHEYWDDDASNAADARLNEFLFYVFQWKPTWLEDRQYNVRPPPIFDEKRVVSTSLYYDKFEDYCKAMGPLLLHEFWHVLKKDAETVKEEDVTEKGKKKEDDRDRSITASLEPKSLSSSNPRSNNFTILDMSAVVEKTDGYPIRGDLVRFTWGGEEIFGYVELMDKIREKHQVPTIWSLKYRIKTKKLNYHIMSGGKYDLVTVLPIGPYLRIVRAMQDLDKSPLFKFVMKPQVADYEMHDADISTVKPLITGHELNPKQLEVVAKVVNAVKDRESKICLIQGPPGTGKSKVILNIICETLQKHNRQILLCAPSNRAIDEVVGNLIEVQKAREKEMKDFTIVRIGREEKMGDQVKEVSLSFHTKMAGLSVNGGNKREREQHTLMHADVIATTLSSCYTFQMENLFGQNNVKIPVCIVDEAAQATELGTLIPLMLGVNTLILVGDPKQLPPTVISEIAKDRGLDESLFTRARNNFDKQNRNPILMLDTQYRMVEEIVRWPNQFFYRGALKTDSHVEPLPFRHYRVFHHYAHQEGNDSNMGEARLVMNLVQGMVEELLKDPKYENASIGIITPYRKQRRVLLEMLKDRWRELETKFTPRKIAKAGELDDKSFDFVSASSIDESGFYETDDSLVGGEEIVKYENGSNGEVLEEEEDEEEKRKKKKAKEKELAKQREADELKKKEEKEAERLYNKLKTIQVNTVDSFQGQERDVIVMSCVRSRGIGFVSDPNRLCVSLTRAKHTLILCGNFYTFKNNTMWRMLLTDAEARRAYVKINAESTSTAIMKHVIKGKN